jgi:hypothetical protein
MAYLAPSEFVTKMVDAGEAKIFMPHLETVRDITEQIAKGLRAFHRMEMLTTS